VNMVSAIMQGGWHCENTTNLRLETYKLDRVDLESHFLGKPVKLGDYLWARRVGQHRAKLGDITGAGWLPPPNKSAIRHPA